MNNELIKSAAILPGVFLKKALLLARMTNKELSLRSDFSEKYISGILTGKEKISQDAALKFEQIFGISARFWIRAQAKYDEFLNRINFEKNILPEKKAFFTKNKLSTIYNYLKNNGWISENTTSKVQALLDFYEVADFSCLDNVFEKQYGMAFERQSVKIDKYALYAWLTCGRKKIREKNVVNYDATLFREALKNTRKLANQELAKVKDQVATFFEKAGVFINYTPPMRGSNVLGFSEWIDGIPVIHISTGYTIDTQWHTLFHEAKHILQNKRKKLFISERKALEEQILGEEDDDETDANNYAANILVPQEKLLSFAKTYNISYMDHAFAEVYIVKFAKELNIHPSIVLGQLQHQGLFPWSTRINWIKKSETYE